jgi:BASS family bile acid:Na+ symporter
MSVDRLINLLVAVTLMEMMVTVGLRVTFGELVETARNWRLVTRAALANYVLVPAVAIALLLLFQAPPLVVAGFLVLAVCPGALTARHSRELHTETCPWRLVSW